MNNRGNGPWLPQSNIVHGQLWIMLALVWPESGMSQGRAYVVDGGGCGRIGSWEAYFQEGIEI